MFKKILLTGVALIMCIGLFAGCSDSELKQGVYVSDNGLASVTLLDDNTFIFVRNIAASYAPTGNYSVKKRKLILQVSEGEEYVFDIKDGQLVFMSGNGVEGLLAKGTKFILSDQ